MNILVLNAGSSSQKMALYRLTGGHHPVTRTRAVWTAHVDWTRKDNCAVVRTEHNGTKNETEKTGMPREKIVQDLIASLWQGDRRILEHSSSVDVTGHRIVHGGTDYSAPVVVDEPVKRAIRELSPLAPAHNPVQLEGIETVEQLLPGVPQVAVFDTAFHRTIPDKAAMYPLPLEWFNRGIRRYGFHGISHQYCTERAAELLDRHVKNLAMVTCHLGNGCSLAAIQNGMSVDTTMGLTPLEGVMMAERCGSIDPAIPLYLMRHHGLDINQVSTMLNNESGLKGVSGLSGDIRNILHAVSQGHTRAALALDMYVHRIRKAVGSMVAVLGGADALIFTAGVGEHASAVRERICNGLECMGIHLDPERNRMACADEDIAASQSPTRILIIHTDEDWITARACRAVLCSR